MKRKAPPSISRLKEVFKYNPFTGNFIYKNWTARSWPGKIAGCIRKDKYQSVSIDGHHYLAHHVAWFYVFGEWPDEIDHKDGIRDNNKINNLRPCTRTQNNGNSNGWGERKKSGLPRGVFYHPADKTRFRAQIYIDYKPKHLGCFDSISEAEAAYKREAKKHFGEFA